jgi:hypothetical protein
LIIAEIQESLIGFQVAMKITATRASLQTSGKFLQAMAPKVASIMKCQSYEGSVEALHLQFEVARLF